MCLGVRVNVMVTLGPTLAPTLTFILDFGLFPGVQYGRDILRPVTAGLLQKMLNGQNTRHRDRTAVERCTQLRLCEAMICSAAYTT